MNVAQRLTTLTSHMQFQSNPAAQRFADTGQPGRTLGHENRTDIAPMNAPRAQGLVNHQVMEKLNATLTSAGIALPETLAPEDFTPEAVSERILGFVRGALAGLVGEDRTGRLAEARAGIEQGIAEARDILKNLDALQGSVAEQLDSTEALIFKGLDALAAPAGDTLVLAPVSGEDDGVPDQVGGQLPGMVEPRNNPLERNFFSYASTERSQNSRIEIRTRDGDIVTVDLSRSSSRDQALVRSQGAGGEALYKEVNVSRSASLAFSVQGELDADEQQAIDQLLQRIDKVSGRFFDGNVQGAFKKAAKLKMDASELAGFTMDLSSSVSRQKVSAYSTNAGTGEGTPVVNPLQQMTDFLRDVRGTLEDINAALFAEPPKAVADLIKGISDTKAAETQMEDDDAAALDLMKATVDELQNPLTDAQTGVLETDQAA